MQGAGTATVPFVGVAPVAVDFGEITIGRRLEVPVEYTNFDASPVDLAGGGFNDNDDAFFAVGSGSDPCTMSSVPAGETCAIDYSFRPGEERAFAASMAIDFGDVEPGTSMTVPVVVTNTSEAPLTGFVGGGVLAPFSLVSDTCGASLAVGESCQLGYRFSAPNANPASTQTLLSFTNSSGIQPTFEIGLYANGAPEPGAAALGATALAALASLRRRRGRASCRRREPGARVSASRRASVS